MKALTKVEFLTAAASLVEAGDYAGNSDTDYLGAVYDWANYFAVNNWDDVEYILSLAEENYAGEFPSDAKYAEHVGEEYFEETLDTMAAAADTGIYGLMIPYSIDWEQFADLVLPNVQGFNFESYQTSEVGTGAYYFREPR